LKLIFRVEVYSFRCLYHTTLPLICQYPFSQILSKVHRDTTAASAAEQAGVRGMGLVQSKSGMSCEGEKERKQG
jgi:hypothetical protein